MVGCDSKFKLWIYIYIYKRDKRDRQYVIMDEENHVTWVQQGDREWDMGPIFI